MSDLVIYEVGVRVNDGSYATMMESPDRDEAVDYINLLRKNAQKNTEIVFITKTYKLVSTVPHLFRSDDSQNDRSGIMSDLRRYDIDIDVPDWGQHRLEVIEDKDGTWCKYEDVRVEIERLNHDLTGLFNECKRHQTEHGQQAAEIERLKREVNVLRQYGNKDCTAMADQVLVDGVES